MVDPFQTPAADVAGPDRFLDGEVDFALLDFDKKRRRFRTFLGVAWVFAGVAALPLFYALILEYQAARGTRYAQGAAVVSVLLSLIITTPLAILSRIALEKLWTPGWIDSSARTHRVPIEALTLAIPRLKSRSRPKGENRSSR